MNPDALTLVVVAPSPDSPEKNLGDVFKTRTRQATRSASSGNEASPSNSVRATAITPVLEEILGRVDYPHWGINE